MFWLGTTWARRAAEPGDSPELGARSYLLPQPWPRQDTADSRVTPLLLAAGAAPAGHFRVRCSRESLQTRHGCSRTNIFPSRSDIFRWQIVMCDVRTAWPVSAPVTAARHCFAFVTRRPWGQHTGHWILSSIWADIIVLIIHSYKILLLLSILLPALWPW